MSNPKTASVFATLDKFIAPKKASDSGVHKEDKTTPAPEGTRSAEACADIKNGVPNSVDGGEHKPGKLDAAGLPPGSGATTLGAGSTGENVPSTGAQQADPGTSHPAKSGHPTGDMAGMKSASTREIIAGCNSALAGLTLLVKAAGEYDGKTEPEKKEPHKNEDPASGGKPNAGEGDAAHGTVSKAVPSVTLVQPASKEAAAPAAGTGAPAADDFAKKAHEEFRKRAADVAREAAKQAATDAQDLVSFLIGMQKAAEGEVDPETVAQLIQTDPQQALELLSQMPIEEAVELLQQIEQAGVEIPQELVEALEAAHGGQGGGEPGAGDGAGAPPADGGAGAGAPPADAGAGAPPAPPAAA